MRSHIRRLLESAGFSPKQLFAALQGAWLEPKQGFIWQENTGVTPTTTGGQTIGLMLDQSQGAVLGPELVTNGSPSDLTGWTNNSTLTGTAAASGGVLDLVGTNSTNRGAVAQPLSLIVGGYYLITWTGTGAGTVGVHSSNAIGANITAVAPATNRVAFLATATTLYFTAFTAASGSTITLTGISVRQVLGNHAYQATAANRPTLQFNGALPLARFDTNDFLSLSLPAINVRRNLLTYSEQFDNGVWLKFRSSILSNAAVAPDGTLTADKLIEDTTATNSHTTANYGSQTVTAGAAYTFSAYVKAAERGYVTLVGDTSSGRLGANGVQFSLANGSVTKNSSSVATTSTNAGNGWWRFSITATAISSGTAFPLMALGSQVASSPNGQDSYTGDGTSGIYIWGAQLELGSVATDYQKITDWTSEAYSSNGSVYFSTPVGMSALHNQSMGTTYTLPALSSDIYSWIVVPQRLNAVQESRLALYMQQKAGIAGPDYFEQVDYGPELVTNGDFATDANWAKSTGVTISGGNLNFDTTSNEFAAQLISITAGKIYKIELEITSYDRGVLNILLGITSSVVVPNPSVLGKRILYVTAGTSTANIRLQGNFGSGSKLSIDNISVRELKDGMTGQLTADDGLEILLAQ